MPNRGFLKTHKNAVELGQSTQYQKVGHYGQIQFGHDCYSLANFGDSYTCSTNTKGNLQNMTEKHELTVDHPFFKDFPKWMMINSKTSSGSTLWSKLTQIYSNNSDFIIHKSKKKYQHCVSRSWMRCF